MVDRYKFKSIIKLMLIVMCLFVIVICMTERHFKSSLEHFKVTYINETSFTNDLALEEELEYNNLLMKCSTIKIIRNCSITLLLLILIIFTVFVTLFEDYEL